IRARADLVKPNLLEAGELVGRPLAGVTEAAAAAREIVARGAGAAAVTLRGDGAVASAAGRTWQVRPPKEDVVRAIGAGDPGAVDFPFITALTRRTPSGSFPSRPDSRSRLILRAIGTSSFIGPIMPSVSSIVPSILPSSAPARVSTDLSVNLQLDFSRSTP